MAKHAELSPSSAERWMGCPGSVPMSRGIKDEGSGYADEGTCAHFLAAFCLTNKRDPIKYVNTPITILKDRETGETTEAFAANAGESETREEVYRLTPDLEFVQYVQDYVDYVRSVAQATNGLIHVEQRMSLEHLTGESGAEGTSDTVIVTDDELIIVDLKFGRGVTVSATHNPQLLMYASAANARFGLVHDFNSVRMVIHQPRLNHVSEDVYTLADLANFEAEVRQAVKRVAHVNEMEINGEDYTQVMLSPSEDACRWCKAKANCPALANFVREQIEADFEDLSGVVDDDHYANLAVEAYSPEELSLKAKAIELIELWCKAVRGKVESLLLSGKVVPDFKLVQGKRGHRKWRSAEEAEAVMKSMRLKVDEMFDLKLISPTSAEKLLKESPKRWARIEPLIVQTEGAPSVAPASDKRPALVITHVADEMEDLTGSDLI